MKAPGIICTIGPASRSFTTMKKLAAAGMNVARLNFSHGDHVQHAENIRRLRRLDAQRGVRVKILQDLEGFRVRIGRLPGDKPRALRAGEKVTLTNDPIRELREKAVPIDYPSSLAAVPAGAEIFIDDGNISLKVLSSSRSALRASVTFPGILKSRKGMNIPSVSFPCCNLTAKDELDLLFGLANGVDYVAQSFVRDRRDVLALKERIADAKKKPKIIAKIENRQGLRNLDGILREADGVMVARGDMGVLIPIFQVPVMQKIIIQKCKRAGKFAITATQMLESMTWNRRPTRAEASDVANACLDGSDFLMLSGETAVGLYPAETVRMMRKIADYTLKNRSLISS